MSRLLVACAVLLGTASFAQAPAAPPPQPKATAPAAPEKPNPIKASAERTQAALAQLPKAKPEDVKSQDAILKALYDVISGPAGAPRDWQRFRSLFYPGAQLIPLARPPGATTLAARPITPEDYVTWGQQGTATQGFFEKEIARQTHAFGALAQVMSTYEARGTQDGPLIAKGVNSIQLFNDGQRWWVMNILWMDEKAAGLAVPKDLTQK
ncbi:MULTISPECIES: nuclear transport factor 2 family protein [unclassified Corallococcus]|uniref:nuclear transport factor 2 family protein n=1 Tax=unclassified Corallococcus TaxID=2685029 RepID=UPI001A8F6ACA|nr:MULTISPECIES: nuclear transport factor 2 family protein [unclassified Corallococcus]MBN9688547.1 nuclear transport factor 2 family protein [Corallococcus sp. NCSPR001]WAS87650.1 nuclear transport factor 2 family protein [Corallococcus sp. NCRR]